MFNPLVRIGRALCVLGGDSLRPNGEVDDIMPTKVFARTELVQPSIGDQVPSDIKLVGGFVLDVSSLLKYIEEKNNCSGLHGYFKKIMKRRRSVNAFLMVELRQKLSKGGFYESKLDITGTTRAKIVTREIKELYTCVEKAPETKRKSL